MDSQERRTVDKLINTFGFDRNRSEEAVRAIGDKSDVQMAYNWLLDHGEEDHGGPVEPRVCDHVHMINLCENLTIAEKCAEGCHSGENWMCLVCGETRCSRYVESHNLRHYQSTKREEESRLTVAQSAKGMVALGHCLAVGLRDQSVWCYECQSYVTHTKFRPLLDQVHRQKFGGPEKEKMEINAEVEEMEETGSMTGVPWREMHGFQGDENWDPPLLVTSSRQEARPGYKTRSASEFKDTPVVMKAKVKILADMVKKSNNCLAYTGAGISTAAGIEDYASVATNSVVKQVKKVNALDAEPTLTHNVLTQMYYAGHVKHWVNQNHDGLPQKAGFPQMALNEIHGGWFDVSNPVVPMPGTLRRDLIEWMLEWEHKTDLCLAMGSSLCGMNSDRLVETPSRRAQRGADGIMGSVIISLQQTQYDKIASLRIFGRTDDVMKLLAEELRLSTQPRNLTYPDGEVFRLAHYDETGQRAENRGITLDLRIGQQVHIVNQPEWDRKRYGEVGLVVGKNRAGHFRIDVGGRKGTLGLWWIREALLGNLPSIPLVNCQQVGGGDGDGSMES